jgi:hypothetical protein
MVDPNGNMVPPLGQGAQEKRDILFGRMKDKDGKSIGVPVPGKWKLSTDGVTDAKGKQSLLGNKPRVPNWAGGCVSVDVDPAPTEANKPCKATIYLHMTLASKPGTKCTAAEVANTMRIMEDAAALLGGKCPCPAPGEGEDHDKNEGRTVEFAIIWHPKAGAGGAVATVEVNCEGEPPDHGNASSESGTIGFDGRVGSTEGLRYPGMVAVCAHELGHLLFGTGAHAPPGWKGDHNPDKNSLMRNTRAPGKGLTGADKPSAQETCMLCDKARLKVGDCCTYKKKADDPTTVEPY